MRAAVMRGPGQMGLEDVPEAVLPDKGVLLDVEACAICGTDVKMLEVGHRDLLYPRILGHEIVGRIVQLKGTSSDLQEGDLVQVWPGIACGVCRPCRRGEDNQCRSMGILGFNFNGGFAERLVLPEQSVRSGGLIKLPSDADPAEMSLAEPLACCLNGQELARVGEDDTVLIFGAGPLGCLHAMVAREKGAKKVLMTEHLESRRKILPKGLADRIIDPAVENISEVINDETEGEGVDVILMSTPEVRVDSWILKILAPRGRVSIFSGPKKGNYEVPMDVRTMHYREMSLVGAYGCSSRSDREAVRMLLDRKLDLRWLISEKVPLEGLVEAFEKVGRRECMKIVMVKY